MKDGRPRFRNQMTTSSWTHGSSSERFDHDFKVYPHSLSLSLFVPSGVSCRCHLEMSSCDHIWGVVVFRGKCHSSLKFAQTGNWDHEFVTVGAFRFARTPIMVLNPRAKSWGLGLLLLFCALFAQWFSTNVCLFGSSVRLRQQPILWEDGSFQNSWICCGWQ